MILPIEEEKVCCFVHGLRLQLRIEIEIMVSMVRAFLDVVDHARTMEKLYHEVKRGNDNRARHQCNYSRSHFRKNDTYERPHHRC